MTQEEEYHYKDIDICRFREKKIESDKVRNHFHLTSKYRGPAHRKCNNIVKQKQSSFIPFAFRNSSKYDSHLLFEKLVYKKNGSVKFDIISRTDEEHIAVTYGCIRFIESYRFLSSCLYSLVNTLDNDDFEILKDQFPDNWLYLNRKLAYPIRMNISIVSLIIKTRLII